MRLPRILLAKDQEPIDVWVFGEQLFAQRRRDEREPRLWEGASQRLQRRQRADHVTHLIVLADDEQLVHRGGANRRRGHAGCGSKSGHRAR